jgi:hypothetical protein
VVFALVLLAGCSSLDEPWPELLKVDTQPAKPVSVSLRPEIETSVPMPAKRLVEPEMSLKLRSRDTRLQLQMPLLAETRRAELRLVARSYWFPDDPAVPEGKLYFELNIPFWTTRRNQETRATRSMTLAARSWTEDVVSTCAPANGAFASSRQDLAVICAAVSAPADDLPQDWHANFAMPLPAPGR